MTSCPECNEQLCKNCLDDMECPCLKENEENKENEDGENENTTTRKVAAIDANEEHDGNFDVIREAARATERTVGIDAA